MSTVSISDDVAEVLKQSTFYHDRVTLPHGNLPREQYMRVARVLEAQGGKWNKKAGCHVFPIDPRQVFEEALRSGKVVHAKKTRQAFFTPPAVVDIVMAYALPSHGHTVLEPSAGEGALADACRERGARVTCVENHEASAEILMRKGHEVLSVDFLELKSEGFQFDLVVMNPPFTKGQDVQHVSHALKFVKPGGYLFAIVGTSFEINGTSVNRAFRDLMRERGNIIERFDNNEFRYSGTDVSTRLIRLQA